MEGFANGGELVVEVHLHDLEHEEGGPELLVAGNREHVG